MITILKILACWGCGSIALGLWIGPMLRSATVDLGDGIGELDASGANDVPYGGFCSGESIACAMTPAPDKV